MQVFDIFYTHRTVIPNVRHYNLGTTDYNNNNNNYNSIDYSNF